MVDHGNGFIQALGTIVAGATQMTVAEKAGVSQGTISKLLNGKTQGHTATVRKLIGAYPELGRFFVPDNSPNSIADR